MREEALPLATGRRDKPTIGIECTLSFLTVYVSIVVAM
jgi:hypothetical protein